MAVQNFVIIGGGHGAAQAITSLKQQKFAGTITLISDEPHIPYQRPPLSKAFLKGDLAEERLPIIRQNAYDTMGVQLKLGLAATTIDRSAQTITLSDGSEQPYDKLIIATGGRARQLPVAGGDLPGVFTIRTRADIEGLQARLDSISHVAVIGGGYIGLEAAAVMRELDKKVTLFEAAPRLLARVTAPVMSDYFADLHRSHGVDVRLGAQIKALRPTREGGLQINTDTESFTADIAITGVGMQPNMEVAESAGLPCDRLGIIVDDHCRTIDTNIYAIGDVAFQDNAFTGRKLRLESVQNAVDQAKVAVANALGEDMQYNALPWFWSDQYKVKLQIAGLSDGYDDIVVRGTVGSDAGFAVFYLSEQQLIAADCVGRMAEFMGAKKLISAHATPDKTILADDSTPFKELLPSLMPDIGSD